MKKIVISGASKGIGRATAEKFVARGERVFNLSRSPSRVTGVIDIAIDLSLDVASTDIVEKLVPQLEGRVDVLIHNAAKLVNDTLQSTESAALADILNINVIAPPAAQSDTHAAHERRRRNLIHRIHTLRKSRGKLFQLCH